MYTVGCRVHVECTILYAVECTSTKLCAVECTILRCTKYIKIKHSHDGTLASFNLFETFLKNQKKLP